MSNIETMTNLRLKKSMNFYNEKIFLGRWCLDSSGYTVSKGNGTRFNSTSSNCEIDDSKIEYGGESIGKLQIFKCDNFYNGQDIRAIAQYDKNAKYNIPQMAMYFICDGHGEFTKGKKCALDVPSIITNNLLPLCKTTLEKIYLNTPPKEEMKEEMKDKIEILFKQCDELILSRYYEGGTTCTIKWFILDPITENIHIYDIILGDSPSLSVDIENEKVEENCFCQNCDEREAVEQWLNTSFREKDAKPPQVVLSRFNTRPRGYMMNPLNWVMDNTGYKMINIYDTKQNDDLTWTLEKSDTLKTFYDKCPTCLKEKLKSGGIQTLRDMPRFREEYMNGGYPTYNFGSTIEGHGQNLGTFGDKFDKTEFKTHCKPNINYVVLDKTPNEVYLMGSDGALDINTDDNIIKAFKVAKNMNRDNIAIADNYCKKLVYYGNKHATTHKWRFEDGLGKWDDQSAWVIILNAGHRLSTSQPIKHNNKEEMGRRQRQNYKRNHKRAGRKRRRRFH